LHAGFEPKRPRWIYVRANVSVTTAPAESTRARPRIFPARPAVSLRWWRRSASPAALQLTGTATHPATGRRWRARPRGGRASELFPVTPETVLRGFVRPPPASVESALAVLPAGVVEARGPCVPGTDGVCRSLVPGQHRRADSGGEATRHNRRSPA